MSVFLIIVGFVTIFLYGYFKYKFSYWRSKGAPFLQPSFPFGNILDLLTIRKSINEGFKNWYDQTEGPFSGLYMFTTPALMVKDPELLKHILIKDFNNFTDRGMYTDEKNEPLSVHLFRMNGQKWKDMRSKLSPSFTVGKLKMMFSSIANTGEQLENYLEKFATNQKNCNIQDVTLRYSSDIIASVIFGLDCSSFINENNQFYYMANDLFQFNSISRIIKTSLSFFAPKILKWFHLETVQEKQSKFVLNVVKEVIDYREKNLITRNDLMQLLIQLKNEGKLSIIDIAAQAYTFFFAGFETAASTLNFLLYECAINTNVQKQLQNHIDSVLEKHKGVISYESIFEMDYLDNVISETLRKYAPIGFLLRVANKEYTIPETGIKIDKGTKIFISIDGIHYDPQFYQCPEIFDPNRFLYENVTKRHPLTYLPFGEGPRNCIAKRLGQIMVAVGVVAILRKYSVSLITEIPVQFSRLAYTKKTTKPIILKIDRR